MLYTEEQVHDISDKFLRFIYAYGDSMPPLYAEYAMELFPEFLERNLGPDILMEIYHELNFDRYTHSFFYDQANFVKDTFDVSGNILEIGSGLFPCFANLIAAEQIKLQKGTITLYDPNISITSPKYKNMSLKKELFKDNYSFKDYDLITGIMPCYATEMIIRKACEEHKQFYIQLCECEDRKSVV